MNAKGYSLLMVPEGDLFDKFHNIIKKLSKKYGAPVFDPHITVLGQIDGEKEEIVRKIEEFANDIDPFEVTITDFGYEDYYFRALFLYAEKVAPLLEAANKARKTFNRDDSFMPHLSLLYGNFDESIKKEIIKELGPLNTTFKVNKLVLCCSEGGPEDWYLDVDIPLKS